LLSTPADALALYAGHEGNQQRLRLTWRREEPILIAIRYWQKLSLPDVWDLQLEHLVHSKKWFHYVLGTVETSISVPGGDKFPGYIFNLTFD
jgi:hypothetical protein